MDRNGILAEIEALLPTIYRRTRRSEEQFKLHGKTIEWIRDRQLVNILDSESGWSPSDRIRFLASVGMLIGGICGSTAWTLMLYALHRWIVRRFGDAAVDRVLRNSCSPLISASFMPTGLAVKKESGFLVSGRWEWVTGIDHADWVIVNAKLGDLDENRFFLIPVQRDVHVVRKQLTGLKASGSHCVVIENAFVESELSISERELRSTTAPGTFTNPDPLLRSHVQPVLATVGASVAVGLCEM